MIVPPLNGIRIHYPFHFANGKVVVSRRRSVSTTDAAAVLLSLSLCGRIGVVVNFPMMTAVGLGPILIIQRN